MSTNKAVFSEYAKVYDALYAEKDYEGECDALEAVFRAHGGGPVRAILDLGCGTGGHAIPLARRGYGVTGVDRSPEMLDAAREKCRGLPGAPEFLAGDLRGFRARQTFDAVVCLFAVMGYQAANEDVLSAYRTARAHLAPGGLFVFDFWYGPAVLRERPSERVREAAGKDGERVLRLASPTLHTGENRVSVAYHVFRLAGGRVLSEAKERHDVRYFFLPEVALMAGLCGFSTPAFFPCWEPGGRPSEVSWNVAAVAAATEGGAS